MSEKLPEKSSDMDRMDNAGDIVDGNGNTVPAGYGAVPHTSSSASYLVIGPSTPEWRRVVAITGDPDKGYQTEVVQDWHRVDKALRSVIERALADVADSDDPPEQQALLMSAWQSLAVYLSSCDDEDKAGALLALKTVSSLMQDGPNDGPYPDGTFGTTTQTAAAEYTCEKCARSFASEQGLINHLKAVHAAREKTPYSKNDPNQGQD